MTLLIPALFLLVTPQSERLSAEFPLGTAGDVREARFSPTTSRIVYRADALRNEQPELFTVPADGSAAVRRIHGRLAGRVLGFELTPDGTGVVYRAEERPNQRELFYAPADGSHAPRRLSGPLVPGGQVGDGEDGAFFVLDPGGSRLAYLADAVVNDFPEVFVIPLDGSAPPLRVGSPGMPPAVLRAASPAESKTLEFSPDGSRVVFVASSGPARFELYSARSDSEGSALRLATSARNITAFRIAPDGLRIVFETQVNSSLASLWSVPIDGSAAAVVLHAPLPADQGVLSFAVAPTNQVVFIADLLARGRFELFATPLDASAPPARLSHGGATSTVTEFALVPGHEAAVFVADALRDERRDLYRVPLAGGASPTRLNLGMIAQGDVDLALVTPDGQRALYVVDQVVDERFDLCGVDLVGPPEPVLLHAPADSGEDVSVEVSPTSGGQRVLFRVGPGPGPLPSSVDLFSVPVDGSQPATRLSRVLPSPTRTLVGIDAPPAAEALVYWADQDLADVDELYIVPADGAFPAVKRSGPLSGGRVGQVESFRTSPNGEWAVYLAGSSALELYSVRTNGGTPRKLNGPLVNGAVQSQFAFSRDSRRVLYLSEESVAGLLELRSAPVDGSAPALSLTPGFELHSPDLSEIVRPESNYALYLHDMDGLPGLELYSAPLDGSSPPTRISAPAQGSVSYYKWALAPTTGGAEHVVYGTFDGNHQRLYRARLDGLGSPTPLTPALDSVALPRYSPDGTRIVFHDPPNLYSIPESGGLPQLLSAPLGTDEYVARFQFSPSGALVYSVARQSTFGLVVGLFSTKADGTGGVPVPLTTVGGLHGAFQDAWQVAEDHVVFLAPEPGTTRSNLFAARIGHDDSARQLNGPLVAGGTIFSFLLSPSGTGLAYRADETSDGRTDLYWVPLDGSSAPRRLNSGQGWADVAEAYRFSPDGKRIAYLADDVLDDWNELFSVRIGGVSSPWPVNDRLYAPGVGSDFVLLDDRALYRARQESNSMELFARTTTRLPRRAP